MLQDIERRKYETEAQKRALVPELRGIAREEYLKKREVLKLSEMKDALEDEEMLFAVGPIVSLCLLACAVYLRVSWKQEELHPMDLSLSTDREVDRAVLADTRVAGCFVLWSVGQRQ